MLGLSELKNTRFYQEAMEEGRQEGRQENQREFVAMLLSKRFSDLDQGLLKVVESLEDKSPSDFIPSLLTDSYEVLIEKFG
jgi:predicted transposase YdaD